jgi:hypothetical protein
MSAGVMLVLALLPGIPMLPFLALGGGAAALAWKARNHNARPKAAEAAAAAAPGLRRPPPRPPPKSRSPPRSRSTTSRSNSATRCCRWSTARTAPTA